MAEKRNRRVYLLQCALTWCALMLPIILLVMLLSSQGLISWPKGEVYGEAVWIPITAFVVAAVTQAVFYRLERWMERRIWNCETPRVRRADVPIAICFLLILLIGSWIIKLFESQAFRLNHNASIGMAGYKPVNVPAYRNTISAYVLTGQIFLVQLLDVIRRLRGTLLNHPVEKD